MSKLQDKLAEEGKVEAAEYDEFACWCKKEADAKTYSIEQAQKKQTDLTAAIEKLDADVSTLTSEVNDLNTQISETEDEKAKALAKRNKQNAKFTRDQADYTSCIKNADQAKKDLHMDAKAPDAFALAQMSAIRQRVQDQFRTMVQKGQLQSSGDIPEGLVDLIDMVKDECIRMRKESDDDEFRRNSKYEMELQANNFDIKTMRKTIKEKTLSIEEKTTDKTRFGEQKEEEAKNENTDTEFRNELTVKCQERAVAFDQSTEERRTEMSKLTEAKEVVLEGVKPNYGANKKLGGASFLQLRGGRAEAQTAAINQARQAILKSADTLRSPVLSTLALKLRVTKASFKKVRSLINDLIERIEDEKKADEEKKGECAELFTAAEIRDNSNAQIESTTGIIAKSTREIKTLKSDIADLTTQISELQTALAESTAMTKKERKSLTTDKTDSEVGKAAVEKAVQILTGGGSYEGDDSGDSIVGLLNVILSDFDRTITENSDRLAELESEFKDFSKKTNDAIKEKEDLIAEKQNDMTSNWQADLEQAESDKATAAEELKSAAGTIKALEPGCTDTESYEQRKQEREEEIAALKDAMKILDNFNA